MDDVLGYDDGCHEDDAGIDEQDQVGTVDVQILLSWFFETTGPDDLGFDMRAAA